MDTPAPKGNGAEMGWVGHNFPRAPVPVEPVHSRLRCYSVAPISVQDKEFMDDKVSLNALWQPRARGNYLRYGHLKPFEIRNKKTTITPIPKFCVSWKE